VKERQYCYIIPDLKEIKGLKVDYYQYLTYKIENGKVSEVLP
jgi:hypothetical protein